MIAFNMSNGLRLVYIAILMLMTNIIDQQWNFVNCQTTHVPILKQVNKQNGDGSYSYGYENADGSYKIETKYPNGEVLGKYGYVDDVGNLREIEYGASRRGFEPAGTGITVAPPVVNEGGKAENGLESDYDDGQYREDPSIYWKTERPASPSKLSAAQFTNNKISQNYFNRKPTTTNSNAQFEFTLQNVHPANVPNTFSQPSYTTNWRSNPQQQSANEFQGHPATNFDPYTGSYTLTYTG